MSDISKSVSYLVRCDEGATRMAAQLRDWTEGINLVFLNFANGLPVLQRDTEDGRRSLGDIHSKVSNNNVYQDEHSPRTLVAEVFLNLVEAHKSDQETLSEFSALFDVIHDVRTALGSMADLMEDVEVFAVNSMIQAQDSGEKGRRLGRITREVTGLTKQAASELERVRGMTSHIEQNLDDLKSILMNVQDRFERLPIRVEEDVYTLFTELDVARGDVLEQVEVLTAGVVESTARISQVIVGLQFDDRCSQISHHLSESLMHLHGQICDLTSNGDNLFLGEESMDDMMDTICFSLGIFEVVAKLVENLENELIESCDDINTFLESLSVDLANKAEADVSADELPEAARKTRVALESFVRSIAELVKDKNVVVSRVEGLANQVFDLRDELRGIRRTAKRFGSLAAVIQKEMDAVGLQPETGMYSGMYSPERLDSLNEEMAETVGGVLKSLDSTVQKVHRRCSTFHQGLVRQEDMLRRAERHIERLMREMDGMLVPMASQGGSSFNKTLTKLFRVSTQLKLEVGNMVALNRQSSRIKSDARNRVVRLTEIKNELLEQIGQKDWEIHAAKVKELFDTCTIRAQREVLSGALGSQTENDDSTADELTLF